MRQAAPRVREADVKRTIVGYLERRRLFFWVNNTGAFLGSYKGKQRFVRFGIKGAPDIFVVVKGCLIGIELKGTGGQLSDAQKAFGENLKAAGGVYIVAYSLEDVTCWLEPPGVAEKHALG